MSLHPERNRTENAIVRNGPITPYKLSTSTPGMPNPQFEILSAFLPPESLPSVVDLLTRWKFDLKITRKRRSKVGDYRPPHNGKGHQVTVNHDLNPYAFLLTLIHEIGHLVVHESYKKRMQPHGKEWKSAYRELLEPFHEQSVFPHDIRLAIDHYFNRLSESNRSDLELNFVLKKYDHENGLILVQELPEKSLFRSQRGQVFRKGPRLRKRFMCRCLDNQRNYLVPPLMEVYPIHFQYSLVFPEDV